MRLRLRRARDAIDHDHASPLDVASLADGAFMSASHFARRYRFVFGETPHQHLLTRRVERAQALLRGGDLSVTEVCLAVGFTSLGSFSARFREVTGQSPTTYRREVSLPREVPGCAVRALTRPPRTPSATSPADMVAGSNRNGEEAGDHRP